MITLLKQMTKERQLKKDLVAFLADMEKNLEYFYVMDQRQFITHGFSLKTWETVKAQPLIKKHESIEVCMQALEEFNRLYKEHKEYELWYTSDMKHKTPENARKLHALKHELDKKLKTLEAIIIPAGQALEREMVNIGLLKL